MNEILWFVSRATGVASILLLTTVLVLGRLTASRRPPRGIRSTVVMGLHRSLALGASAFLFAHIATAVIETYVDISALAAIVPFTSGYETAWVGLGTIAVDIAAAVVLTSVLRHRLPERLWRGVHAMAFVLWPLAVIHGIALSTTDQPILRGLTIASAIAGVGAIGWRVLATDPHRTQRRAVALQEWS